MAAAELATDQGAAIYLAHPYWTGRDANPRIDTEHDHGVEIYNAASELECGRDGPVVEMRCSPCRAVVLQMEHEKGCSVVAGRHGRKSGRVLGTSESGLITHARVESSWADPKYIRVRVIDADGHSAWTNPL